MSENDDTPKAVRRNDGELAKLQEAIARGEDRPILMLNLNRYKPEAGFPDGAPYRAYATALDKVLPEVGGKVLWRSSVAGQMVGEQAIHEVLAVWYPSGQAFLDLRSQPSAPENFRLRAEVVEYAVIHRCDGETPPLGG